VCHFSLSFSEIRNRGVQHRTRTTQAINLLVLYTVNTGEHVTRSASPPWAELTRAILGALTTCGCRFARPLNPFTEVPRFLVSSTS
jgi:hypothetical protein